MNFIEWEESWKSNKCSIESSASWRWRERRDSKNFHESWWWYFTSVARVDVLYLCGEIWWWFIPLWWELMFYTSVARVDGDVYLCGESWWFIPLWRELMVNFVSLREKISYKRSYNLYVVSPLVKTLLVIMEEFSRDDGKVVPMYRTDYLLFPNWNLNVIVYDTYIVGYIVTVKIKYLYVYFAWSAQHLFVVWSLTM